MQDTKNCKDAPSFGGAKINFLFYMALKINNTLIIK